MTTLRTRVRRVAVGAIALAAVQSAHGAGFALIEMSASGMGNAFAGGAAAAEDASTITFNPAGLTRLEGTRASTAAHIVVPSAEFTDQGSTINPTLGGGALPGSGTENPSVSALVPNMYFMHSLGSRVRLGVGITSPFGLKTDYTSSWTGRYNAISSSLKTINVNPTLAVRFNDHLSVGVGLNLQYAAARLTNAIDMVATCVGSPFAAACGGIGLAAGAGFGNPLLDGTVDLQADGISGGYNVGILVEVDDKTRFGAHYRSQISHKLKGDADFGGNVDRFNGLAAGFGAPGQLADQEIIATAKFPETVSLSAFHEVNSKWSLMADATYTRWSRLERLVIEFQGGQRSSALEFDWNPTWRLAVGANYKHSDHLTLRGGLAFDESPVPGADIRSPRVPDADRVWVSFGVSYDDGEALSIDAGYSYLFVGDVKINNRNGFGHFLTGEYEADVNILSAQLNYRF